MVQVKAECFGRSRALVLAMLMCLLMTAGAQAQPRPPAPLSSGLERQDIRGLVRAKQFATLSSEIGAVVKTLHLPEGARFNKGMTLVSLDCGLLEAQAAKLQTEVRSAMISMDANRRLVELDAGGKMELELARTNVARAEAELAVGRVQMEKCRILAPFDGVVAEHRFQELQFAQPGQALVDVFDDASFELEFLAPSVWMTRMRLGSLVRLEVDELRKPFSARILRLSPRIDPVGQTIKVTARLEGQTADLRPGMSGRVLLP
jgi:membrane fusion protein (multidrug efflux system)